MEPQITFDVRQPKTKAYSLERLRRFLDTHEYVDVVRFTTFSISLLLYLMNLQERNM